MTSVKRCFYFVLALLVLMSTAVVACGGSESSYSRDRTARSGSSSGDRTARFESTPSKVTEDSAGDSKSSFFEAAGGWLGSTKRGSGYEELLGTVPDTPEVRSSVHIDDYALVRSVFDLPDFHLPGPEDNEATLQEFYAWRPPLVWEGDGSDPPIFSFGGTSFFGAFPQHRNHIPENLQYLAFDVRNIDQTITAGPLDDLLDVVRGGFDPRFTGKALESCSACSPPSLEKHRGVLFYSWGEDYKFDPTMTNAPPAFDHLGRGGRIAVLDEYVFRAFGTGAMRSLIDTHMNENPSLADVEEFRLLAGGMSQLGAYTMFLSDNVETFRLDGYAALVLADLSPSEWQIEILQARFAEPGPLRPYEAFASGAGTDEHGTYMALVLVHAGGGDAKENVALLRARIERGSSAIYETPWSSEIDKSEIQAEGRLVLAKLRGAISLNPFSWVYRKDNLILYK